MSDDATLVLIGAVIGAVVGAAGTLAATWMQNRAALERVREEHKMKEDSRERERAAQQQSQERERSAQQAAQKKDEQRELARQILPVLESAMGWSETVRLTPEGGDLENARAAARAKADQALRLTIEAHDAQLRTGVQQCLDAITWVHLGSSFPTLGAPLVVAELKADLWTFIGPFVRGDEARGEVPPRITAAAKAYGSIASQR